MIARSCRFGLFTLLVMQSGCSSREDSHSTPAASSLPPGAVARVGAEQIGSATVVLIAERQGLAAREALSRVVSDAAWALAARAATPSGVVSSIERAAAARALLEQIGNDAARGGPPTEAEITNLVEERWVDLARPDAARVTHAVAIVKNAQQEAAGRAVAERVLAAVSQATSSEQFMTLAKAVPSDGIELKVESLPAVTADGRTFEKRDNTFAPLPATFDLAFARGANALRQPGQISPVVVSDFGYHVLYLDEHIPGSQRPRADLANQFSVELQTRRAVRIRLELLEKLRSKGAIQIDRAVDDLTGRIQASP